MNISLNLIIDIFSIFIKWSMFKKVFAFVLECQTWVIVVIIIMVSNKKRYSNNSMEHFWKVQG